MIELRSLIFQTADEIEGVGEIVETLKWGELSFLTHRPKSGSTLRISPAEEDKVGLFFICHTNLVARFDEMYPNIFENDGKRKIILDPQTSWLSDELRHCIGLTLTYHLK